MHRRPRASVVAVLVLALGVLTMPPSVAADPPGGTAVTGVTPSVVARGASLTVAGSGFAAVPAQNTVTINGVPAAVTAATASQLTFTVPSTATSGPVVVATAAGTATSPQDVAIPPSGFTVAQTLPAVRLTDATPTVSAVAGVDQVSVLTVPLTSGERLAVRLTASTFGTTTSKARVSVLRPDGTALVGATGFATAGVWLDARAVPTTGTYTILVDPQGTAVGQVTVEALRVPADAVASTTPGSSTSVTTTVPGQNATVTFPGTAGRSVAVALSAATLASPTAGTVRLLAPDGSTLVASTGLPSTGVFLDAVTLPADGNYTVAVDAAAAQTGSVDVTVHDVPTGVTEVAATDGTPVLVGASVPGQNPTVSFTHPGGRVAIDLSASTFGASTNSAKVSVLGPDGSTLVAAVKFGTAGTFLDVRDLPAGQLRVVVDPTGAILGGVTVRVWLVPADVEVVAVPGATSTVTTTTPGQNAVATLTVAAAGRLSLLARTGTFTGSAQVKVLGPDGGTVVAAFTPSTTGTFVEPVALPTAGTYRVVVDPVGAGTGTVAVTPYLVADATGPLDTSGTAATVAVPTPGQVVRRVVTVAAGDRLALNLTASTFGSSAAKVTVTGPGGTVLVAARTFSAAGTFVDTVVVPTAGDVTVTVDPVGAAVGQLDVAAWRVPADVALDGAVGGTQTVATGTPGQGARLTFTGVAGQKVALRLTSSTYGSSTASARVSVLRPDGTALLAATGFGTAGVFVDQLQLTVGGTYVVVVDPQTTAVGQVAVELVDLDGLVVDAAADGQPVTVATTTGGQNARVRFTGVAGERVAVRVRTSTYGSTSTLRLSLTGPDGTVLVSPTGVAAGTFLEPRTLLADGVHTLSVDPQGTVTGEVTLELVPVPADLVVAGAADGVPVPVALAVPGQNATIELPGVAGQVVSLAVQGSTFGSSTGNLRVSLLAPDGSAVVAATGVGSSPVFVDVRTLPTSGTYRVVVDPQATAVGAVQVAVHTVVDAAPVALVPGTSQLLTTATPGQGASAAFVGSAGGRLALRLSGSTYSSAKVSVLRPDGTALVAPTTVGAALFLDTVELTQDGTYRVVLDPQGAAVGAVTVDAVDVAPDAVLTAAVDGSTTRVTTAVGQDAVVQLQAVAGSRLAISLGGSTYGSSTGSARVSLLGPDGTVLLSPTGFGTNGTFVEPRTLPADGTYTVLVDPQGAAAGAVDVALYDVPADVTASLAVDGAAVRPDVTVPGQNAVLTADVPAGVALRLAISDGAGSVKVTVRNPAGTSVTSRTVSASGGIVAFTPTVAGAHTVTLDPAGTLVGAWTAELYGAVGTPQLSGVDPAVPWLTDSRVSVWWSVDHSGTLAGWALLIDDEPTTDPGTTVTTTDTYREQDLADGEHWVHVRGILTDGTYGKVAHQRIGVDTTSPSVVEVQSPTHPDPQQAYTDRHVELDWTAQDETSGVVGYDVRLTTSSTPPSTTTPDDGTPTANRSALTVDDDPDVDTTEPGAALDLPADGQWFVHVRAVDAAGLWGQFGTYAMLVDATPPGAPTVAGSHADGVPTSQRRLTATFTAPAEDNVSAWAAVVDGSPSTVPAPSLARVEPRIAADLQPGGSWLHVVAQDALGRWGAVTHVRLEVTDPPVALLVPSDKHLWAATTVQVACADGADGAGLAVASSGTVVVVAGLVDVAPGLCAGTWDVGAEQDGTRTWPDGPYELVVLDDAGVEVSERVAVTVDVDASSTARLQQDYDAGVLTADELARYLVAASVDPDSLPEVYRAGATREAPTAAQLVTSLTAGGALSEEAVDMLTPVDLSAGRRSLLQRAAAGSADCGLSLRFMTVLYDCRVETDHFDIYYDSDYVGDVEDGDDRAEFVQLMMDTLELSRDTYEDNGFEVSGDRINVALEPWMPDGSGVSFPRLPGSIPFTHTRAAILMDSSPDRVHEYLPTHEYFHQVEYQYIDWKDVVSPHVSAYWFMEASAEWGAHLVQSQRWEVPNTSTYARELPTFLEHSSGRFDSGEITSSGGQEYGAFVVAEFVEEEYGGIAGVEDVWSRIGDGLLGASAMHVLTETFEDDGDTFGEAAHRMRQWLYVLGDQAGVGFEDPDADTLWRDEVGSSGRPPTTSEYLSADETPVEGEARLSGGGATYVELHRPPGSVGDVVVEVEGQSGRTHATLLPMGGYPDLCSSGTQIADDDLDGSGSVRLDGTCHTAVLVLTNGGRPDDGSSDSTFSWSAHFEVSGAQLSNGTIDLGVTRYGSLILDGVGARRAGDTETEVLAQGCECEGWGVSQLLNGDHGGVDSTGRRDNVESEEFTSDGTTATTVTTTGGLRVTHRFSPSLDPDLYRIDVRVERELLSFGGDVTYRRAFDFDVAPTPFDEYISWVKSDGGDDTRVKAITNDGFADPDPSSAPSSIGSVGYVERFGPNDQGGLIDIDLGLVGPLEPVEFTLYVGVSTSRAEAEAAVEHVGADVYELGEASSTVPGEAGNTAVFAYRAPTGDGEGTGMRSMERSPLARAAAPAERSWAPTVAGTAPTQQEAG